MDMARKMHHAASNSRSQAGVAHNVCQANASSSGASNNKNLTHHSLAPHRVRWEKVEDVFGTRVGVASQLGYINNKPKSTTDSAAQNSVDEVEDKRPREEARVVNPSKFNSTSSGKQKTAHAISSVKRAIGIDSTQRWSRRNSMWKPGNLEAATKARDWSDDKSEFLSQSKN